MAEARYFPEFIEAIRKYSNAKKSAKRKIEVLLDNPLGFGEPLRHGLRGLNSCPVKKGFIIKHIFIKRRLN